MSHCGHFSKRGDEYIINRPDTPKPWVNYLTNGNYCALVSQTGGGYSFVGDAGYDRILREQPGEELIYDRPGRYIYIRDNDTGRYWGLTWQPTTHRLDFFEARHGLGYTSVHTRAHGIEGKITYFVPLEDTCELWMTSIKNESTHKRNLSIFIYVEWSLANHQANLTEASFNNLFNDMEFKDGVIYATKRRWERPDISAIPWDKVAFLTINKTVDSFDCLKEKFIGMYGSLHAPKAVKEGMCSESEGDGHDSIGALQKNIILKPDEELNFDVILGVEKRENYGKQGNKWKARTSKISTPIAHKYKKHDAVEEAYTKVREFWRRYSSQVTVKTPDPDFDISFNFWNKYQAWTTAQWSLMDSYYTGGGATYGFRDMCQHILGTLPNDLAFSKERVKTLLSYQFSEGKTVHNWNALLKQGIVTDHSDDPQWLVFAVISYIYESGDIAFFDEVIPYYDFGQGTVLEHVSRAIDHTLHHTSDRGMPLRRTADWNDALNGGREGKGESGMVANQLAWNLRELAELLEVIGKVEVAEQFHKTYNHLRKTLNEHFWEGNWYIRATTGDKKPIGSHRSKEAKIDINGQTWPILSGVATQERARKAMDAVWRHLMTDYGPMMLTPPFCEPCTDYGIISQFTPGTKENGAIFNHPITWAIIAECLLGRGDKAYEIWRRSSFVTRGKNPELYRVEPYVYSEFVYGPSHPEFGRGSFTWTTGSASWFWRACLDYICGVRPRLEGLIIDPCLPSGWKELEVKRHFRGAYYHIRISNPLGMMKGIQSITVDGEKLDGNLLPVFSKGHHVVEVVMGTPLKAEIPKDHDKTHTSSPPPYRDFFDPYSIVG